MSNPVMRRAERRKAKLRIGLFGPSGSGKTMSALKIASGIAPWEKICVIDTENGSADLYSEMGPYNTITISPDYTPEKYVEAIKAAEAGGMEVIIVDSISHEWTGTGGMLEIADSMLGSIRDGRLIWARITPRHNRFIDALLQSKAHTISCGRSKQEMVLNERESGGRKSQSAEKVGMKAVTREGFDYEMTITFDLAINHYATSTKDRSGLFQDKPARILDAEVGKILKGWADDGTVDINEVKRELVAHLTRLGYALPSDSADKIAYIKQAVQKLCGIELGPTGLDTLEMLTKTNEALVAYTDPAKAKALFQGLPA